jgi:hypothetical protein
MCSEVWGDRAGGVAKPPRSDTFDDSLYTHQHGTRVFVLALPPEVHHNRTNTCGEGQEYAQPCTG